MQTTTIGALRGKGKTNVSTESMFLREGNRLIFKKNDDLVWIEPWGRDSLRVRCTAEASMREDLDWALLPQPPMEADIEISEKSARLRNGAIEVEVDRHFELCFRKTKDGAMLLREVSAHGASPLLRPSGRCLRPIVNSDLYRVEARFEATRGERFYGLGQHRHGLLDQKGAVLELAQRNCEVNIPFLVSNRGYGFLWNNPAIGRVELAANGTRWTAHAARQLDYWITTGASYAGIMERYADATGHAPVLPHFASGFWQCKLRYWSQEQLLSVAREHKRRGLPLSVIVIDFHHWPKMGDFRLDPRFWPDPQAMVKELKDMGIEVMISVWPAVEWVSENFAEMVRLGYLTRAVRGMPVHTFGLSGAARYYDATHPEARRYVWAKCKKNYYDIGIRVFWLDACEPETYPADHDNLRYQLGSGSEVGNLYPFLHEKGFHDGLKEAGETEIITLCRSAWAGSQRFGAAVWSGDIESTFEVLAAQVRAGLNMAMSGIPWWTTDIGGFSGGDPRTPYFQELIVRWFQYGVFCPLFRLHGAREPFGEPCTGADNEVWSFGEKAYGIIAKILFLRERLRPYIMEQMKTASRCGTPPMRPLFFDFAEDSKTYEVEDQFLFGPDILVAPVLTQGAISREVYLPAGTHWRDAWTGQRYDGGQTITAAAPLETIPVYLRGDAQWPIAEGSCATGNRA